MSGTPHPRAFAQAAPSSWNALPQPSMWLTPSPSSSLCSSVAFWIRAILSTYLNCKGVSQLVLSPPPALYPCLLFIALTILLPGRHSPSFIRPIAHDPPPPPEGKPPPPPRPCCVPPPRRPAPQQGLCPKLGQEEEVSSRQLWFPRSSECPSVTGKAAPDHNRICKNR